MVSVINHIRQARDRLLDVIYPPRCAHCGRLDWRWCPRCAEKLEALPLSLQFRKLPAIEGAVATGAHDGVLRDAIHGLKYAGVTDVAPALARRAAAALRETGWVCDWIVPVPLSRLRLRERGYNQSEVIGAHMMHVVPTQLAPRNALIRTRETPSQVGRNADARRENVNGAFQADAQCFSGTTLLLLDDVMTSGATLQACADAARMAGARRVLALTISGARLTTHKEP